MIWALLALLGVPVWLIVGALTATLWSRRSFRNQPEVFAVKIRQESGDSWPRRRGYARIVHDVLVLNTGLALVRTSIHGIAGSAGGSDDAAEGCGLEDPVVVALTYDDGARVLLATTRPLRPELTALLHPTDP